MSWAEDMGIDCGFLGLEEERLSAIKKVNNHIAELKEELIRRKIYPFAEPSDFIWETKDGKKIYILVFLRFYISSCYQTSIRQVW